MDQAERTDTAKLILQHASLLFLKSGYAAVSISAITNAAGITKPTLYHYFPDKEHLYTAVICDCLERTGKEIVAGIERKGTVREKLFHLAYGYFLYARMSISTFMRDVEEHLHSCLVEKVRTTYDLFIVEPHCELIRRGMESGELENHPDQVRLFTDIWLGLLDSLSAHVFYMREDREKLLETTEMIVSVFLDGVSIKNSNVSS
ncbi:TetR/AcrR family transcriptional regulator [Paenactinomyces guangxiensis]|uniref:TetR/AcrR family transcriptional regulator n=1 Tax=Paenactinomyces guangxiensis TaxID=1490290 RepID=A0A7W1WR89_9BACL|nr:TetR/AcrR family transcriptional regulator [Paenactinomyces guangxiensis]MBA4494604.1 TetR/AcrR family transcriptional regulator [Paenactinomyces guangxiensis]MBH8591633.1 TetR/AcrR family transcriptional regulator [Paenactinomyces guangxiensis]